jgi:peptide/nickel transport system permease protein
MIRYVARRVIWGLAVIWAVVTLAFIGTALSPVDPVDVYAGRFATEEVREQIRDEFGLDEPVPVRYVAYLRALAEGNMGVSMSSGQPVADAIGARLPDTARLALLGVLLEILIGVPLGIAAALTRGSLLDRFVLLFSLAGALLPMFVVGFILLYVLAYRAALFPIGGYGGLDALFLPALTIGLAGAPWLARMVRSTVLDVRSQDYVRAARARGCSPTRVVARHVLPNAVNPIVTMVGIDLAVLFAGVLVVEKVYGWPGIGQQAWLAVSQNDVPLIMGTVIVAAAAIVTANLLADVANMLIDPRIRRQ